MKTCEYPSCERAAQFFMGWTNENGKHSGLVCTTHDKELGRTNLCNIGMPLEETILFERYLKETVELESYLDFPEWLVQIGAIYTPLTPTKVESYKGTAPIQILGLSVGAYNALWRHGIYTIEELIKISPNALLNIRTLGVKKAHEIQERLKEFLDES